MSVSKASSDPLATWGQKLGWTGSFCWIGVSFRRSNGLGCHVDGRARWRSRAARATRPLVMAPPVVSRTLSSRERRDCPPVGDFDAAGHCALLSQLVYPLSPADFRGRHWRSCALAVHGPAERIEGLGERMLHQLSLRRLLDATPSEEIHVWLRANRDPQHATASAANGASRSAANKSFTVAETSAALSCYESGASLYFRAPPEASDLLVTALSQQLGLSFGAVRPGPHTKPHQTPTRGTRVLWASELSSGRRPVCTSARIPEHTRGPRPQVHNDGAPRCEVETFASRTGHVTDWHFDFMENFTLQLRGKKRWRLLRSTVSHPLRGCTPQWGAADARVADAAETQAKCHAQHASGPFEPAPPNSDFDGADVVELDAGAMLYTPAGVARSEMVDEAAT